MKEASNKMGHKERNKGNIMMIKKKDERETRLKMKV